MKPYQKPETKSLVVMTQNIICVSGGGTSYGGSIGKQGQTNVVF